MVMVLMVYSWMVLTSDRAVPDRHHTDADGQPISTAAPRFSSIRYGSLIDSGNDLIDPPPWRTRTTTRKLAIATTVTVGLVSASGAVLMLLVIRLLDFAGAPAAVTWAPWYVPTVAAVVWTTRRPKPATVEDGDESWVIHALRTALVGVDTPRPTRVRVTAALALGAPIVWSLVIVGVLALVGIV